jgi:hypothetical protein
VTARRNYAMSRSASVAQKQQWHAFMTPNQIIHSVQTNGILVLRGATALQSLRSALFLATKQLNLSIVFEPESEADIVDYLTVVTAKATDTALDLALVGLLLGALFGRPGVGASIGLGLGAAIGLVEGVDRVDAGWRIVARRDSLGVPFVSLSSET